jgi:toxin ParE1/3/4
MKLRWVPQAAEDLREIHDFLHVNSPQQAHRVVNEIYSAILALSRTPYIGRPNETRSTRDLILSRIRYIVTYRIRNETIEVLYIRHSARAPRIN